MTRFPSISLAALLVAFALAGQACSPSGEDAADGDAAAADSSLAPVVEVLVADPGLFEDIIQLTGTVASSNDAMLSPDVPGTLTYVAPVGTFVRAGGTVAQVSPATARATVEQSRAGVEGSRAQVASAEAGVGQAQAGIRAARAQRQAAQAQLDLAQDQYKRQFPLYRDSILSALEFRNVETSLAGARAQVAQADAGIAQAEGQFRAAQGQLRATQSQVSASQAGLRATQTQLAKTRIVAPFSGVVEQRLMSAGELASPGNPVVRLVASSGVKIQAGIPERYAGEIGVGTQVLVTPSAYSAEPRGGRVFFVGSAIDPQTRTFPIEIALDDAEGALKPAMVVRLGVTRNILTNVISVPQEAVIRDERGTSVFVATAGEGGKTVVARRVVQVGPTSGPNIVLRDGVKSGDRIIVSGQTGLAEGDEVRVTERRAAPVAAAAVQQ